MPDISEKAYGFAGEPVCSFSYLYFSIKPHTASANPVKKPGAHGCELLPVKRDNEII